MTSKQGSGAPPSGSDAPVRRKSAPQIGARREVGVFLAPTHKRLTAWTKAVIFLEARTRRLRDTGEPLTDLDREAANLAKEIAAEKATFVGAASAVPAAVDSRVADSLDTFDRLLARLAAMRSAP